MKATLNQRAGLTLVFLAFAGTLFYLSFGLGSVARTVPFAIVIPTLLLLVVQLLMDLLPGLAAAYRRVENKDLFKVEGFRGQFGKPTRDKSSEALERKSEAKALLWLLAMLAMIWILGFVLALPLYTLIYLKKRSEKWLVAIPIALVIGCLVYGLSLLNLGARLYEGLLWQWLER